MKKLLSILLIFISFSSIKISAQQDNLVKYLDACKTIEFEESEAIISTLSFPKIKAISLVNYENPIGILFDTDVSGVKGYKAIVNCKIKTKDSESAEKKMIVIMYIHKNTKQWSVYEFRESCSPLKEYSTLKEEIDNGKFYTKKQYVYRNASYWSSVSGKFNDCRKYIDLAKKEASLSGDKEFEISDPFTEIDGL